ncbi:3-phosphoglycerate dehydrogenase [Candidatus Micrarchaeota archaeon CG10_big_fil_rev_8_21_14_0_10_45_29]|nr:MAG: 3-phosphoglycerate dehydrogenase [Candidatus Micrarchaeota archaeon CG10_big_fil_rev_8_21_14_0_10_45_29]
MMVKIVIADAMKESVVERLKGLGEVVLQPADLKKELEDADALVVRSATKVSAELIEGARKLKIVARAGVGLDNVDKDACAAKGIKVVNTPGASTNAVAELAIGMMICLMRKTGYLNDGMKEGKWLKKEGMGEEISAKTLGIFGMGRIGQEVAKKASALGMNVVYFDREKKDVQYKYFDSLEKMLEVADVVSLHASAQKGAAPVFDAKAFSKMKKGTYFLNLARGALVDEKALFDAIKSGRVAGAALDVYEKEPYSGELVMLDNVLLTPHIGASTAEAQERIGEDLILALRKGLGI